MIIWSRWGILVVLMAGLGAGSGFLLGAIVGALVPGLAGSPAQGLFAGLGLIIGAVYTYLLDRFVLTPHLDKPRQQFVMQQLPQPVGGQTYRQVPLVHPETGQPIWVQPRSSLFFVPVRYWPAILASIGVLVTFLGFVSVV
ncbi:hypothetical protein [Microlunatus flavus]|uniref:Uncharacterized protein n=1 Tax=Microlunatus flavus TaxID=1036181 RepID=A0A1H9MIU0_9ACTN|nr:hypothetical protein [Microlunatus flavus]SER23568.1 hypothetical protein SAMN05421756_110158 [Microlunatus flavus]